MTLADLTHEVHVETHLPELEILHRVRSAWPRHQRFTATQAALMVRAIEREMSESQIPRTLTDEQIWGRG